MAAQLWLLDRDRLDQLFYSSYGHSVSIPRPIECWALLGLGHRPTDLHNTPSSLVPDNEGKERRITARGSQAWHTTACFFQAAQYPARKFLLVRARKPVTLMTSV